MENATNEQSGSLNSLGQHAQINGINLYYEIHGSGEPLVLIHGGGSTINTTFSKILPILAQKHQAIAVELQAHGRTSDRNSPESFEQDADDVAALLTHLNITKANIFGFSNGGSTTLQIAIRHPKLVNKLIAVSPMYKRSGMHSGFWQFMENATFEDMPQLYKDEFLSLNPDLEKLKNMHDKDLHRMLSFTDWKDEDLKSITAPAWIIVSDQDVVRPEHALEMVQLMPKSKLAIFPGTHGSFIGEAMAPNPNSKVPELFVEMLNEFLIEVHL